MSQNWWVSMLAALPFVWATAGFVALSAPPATDHPASIVVAQYFASHQ
ncbi:MAG: hypothetical protein FJZ00_11445 [Candidatus Sericytochromatia bacterium]|uniref:Uncharacterized protein n=1 Tax=Candidatus Tanganyikabacteria bacterium TaxID=2961651 RepID=A0A937X7W0_9BACT|nr:hypothetical protein [Candidatus Tanganyikabacteria bacterium]